MIAPTSISTSLPARGLEEAVVQSTQIGAVNGWLRGQPAEVVTAAIVYIREAFSAPLDDPSVRLARAPPVYPILGHSVLVPRRFKHRVS